MTVKETVYNCIMTYKMNKHIRTRGECELNMSDVHNVEILYVTVAFNDVVLIKYQHRLLKRFARNKFSYMVADNSDDNIVAGIIKEYCVENQIPYIKLPDNPMKLSNSHAAALNWICRNKLVCLKNVEWVGFIDHDCFPVKEISVPDVKQEFYGFLQNRGEKWYLWPGFCFFRTSCIDIGQLDFCCTKWGDTGSAMYETIYKKIERGNLKFAEMKFEQILTNGRSEYFQECNIQIFDGRWFHVSNGSNWLNVENSDKMDIVYQMLDKILE